MSDVDSLPRFIELDMNRVEGYILVPFLLFIPLSLGIIIFFSSNSPDPTVVVPSSYLEFLLSRSTYRGLTVTLLLPSS